LIRSPKLARATAVPASMLAARSRDRVSIESIPSGLAVGVRRSLVDVR
jgi:hypothetical protein